MGYVPLRVVGVSARCDFIILTADQVHSIEHGCGYLEM